MTQIFAKIRSTSWPIILLVVVAYACSILFVNAVLFQGKVSEALGALYVATSFLIRGSLVAGLFDLVVVGFVIFRVGRLRASDVGWTVSALAWGLLATLGLWMGMQAAAFIAEAMTGDVDWHEVWHQRGASALIGGVLGQLLGNALVEETVFRGFLLPQLFLKANRVLRPASALAIAVIGSSGLFAVTHIPNRLLVGQLAGMNLLQDQAGLFVAGLSLAVIYLLTRNVFFAVGLHTLTNEPAPLFHTSSPVVIYAIWFALTIVFVIGWWIVQTTRSRAATRPR